ncbi:MAG: hypothetical protein PHF18_07025 [Methanosarcina sp.]|uniref:hypothetical protein n=1 Tax=Methanosarcina sp. TaxID=2213 RepID=UPI002636CB22|nr:hypothetical protein [Methanosarcina sp.]MDD3246588.1 hypothetical protein [Methanosarcina sp.]MDD4248842.1 hypothetical protein [Methanosarcina sp.]
MVQETRILHTADTHLGYRQYHNEVRRQDFFKAFEVVIQDAVDMQVDAVLCRSADNHSHNRIQLP